MNKQKIFGLLTTVLYMVLIHGCYKRIDPECPIVTTLNPNGGKEGDIITVKGKKFDIKYPGIYSVNIGSSTIPLLDIPNDSTLRFTVPQGGKSGPLTISVKGAGCSSTPQDFTYYYKGVSVNQVAGTFMSVNCANATDNCFSSPIGLDLDDQGRLIVADKANYVVRRLNASSGAFDATFGQFKPTMLPCDAPNVPLNGATLNYPYDVETDGSNIYVAEEFNKMIRVLKGGSALIIAGSCTAVAGPCGSSAVSAPYSLSKDGNNLYFADNGSIKVVELSTSGVCNNVRLILAKGPGQYFRGLEVNYARTGQGPIFIADEQEHNIKACTTTGNATTLTAVASGLSQPVSLTLDSKGNIFIADKGNSRIYVLYSNGNLMQLAGGGLLAQFNEPSGLALDEANKILYISDTKNNVIRKLTFQ